MDSTTTELPTAAVATVSPLRNGLGAELTSEKRPIQEVISDIELHAKASDDGLLSAATFLRELIARFHTGEFGNGLSWLKAVETKIKLSRSQLHLLNAIARAEDPRAELERQREKIRQRAKKHRAKKKGSTQAPSPALEPERLGIMTWATNAPIDDVRAIARQVARLGQPRGPVGETQCAPGTTTIQ